MQIIPYFCTANLTCEKISASAICMYIVWVILFCRHGSVCEKGVIDLCSDVLKSRKFLIINRALQRERPRDVSTRDWYVCAYRLLCLYQRGFCVAGSLMMGNARASIRGTGTGILHAFFIYQNANIFWYMKTIRNFYRSLLLASGDNDFGLPLNAILFFWE